MGSTGARGHRRLTRGLPQAYLDELWNRWKFFAHAARYGNQPITVLLGRQPTEFELQLFSRGLDFWLEAEMPDSGK